MKSEHKYFISIYYVILLQINISTLSITYFLEMYYIVCLHIMSFHIIDNHYLIVWGLIAILLNLNYSYFLMLLYTKVFYNNIITINMCVNSLIIYLFLFVCFIEQPANQIFPSHLGVSYSIKFSKNLIQ